MTILELYRAILAANNFVVGDDNLVSYVIGGEKVPAMCNGKRIVFPASPVLQNPDWDNTIAFHPMSEAIIRGESPMIRKLKVAVMARITTVASCLLTDLMGMAVDTDYHKKLSPTQSEFLSLIGAVNADTLKKLNNLMDVISIDGERRLMSLFIKRGGTYKGKGYQRVAVVDFPLIEQLKSEGTKAYDVNMGSLKNKKAILALFNYILPDADVAEAYSFGSNSMAAPNLHALLSSFVKIAKKLNKMTHLFRKHLDNPDELHIDLSFADHIDDLAQYRDMIPSLQGNEGDVGDGHEGIKASLTATTAAPKHNVNRLAQAVVERESAAPTPFQPQNNDIPFDPPFSQQPVTQQQNQAPTPGSWKDLVAKSPALQQQNAAFQQANRFAQPQLFQSPQSFQPPVQVTRGGYAQPQTFQTGAFNNGGFRSPQGGLFGQQQQQQVMFPNGI
jgi:hypothetical protein